MMEVSMKPKKRRKRKSMEVILLMLFGTSC
jgi:hypothetical protein